MAGIVPKNGAQVLIVDDSRGMCDTLSVTMQRAGLRPKVAHSGQTALGLIRSQPPDIVLLDVKMPGMDGIEVLRRAKRLDRGLPVVMITGCSESRKIVNAMKAGAFDYLVKPFGDQDLMNVIRNALAERDEDRKPTDNVNKLRGISALRSLMGSSVAISDMISAVARVAESDFSVVLIGETGTGKELVALAIHEASFRSRAAFVPVDCGAIPESLMESELFGHERGSFTGAIHQKQGKFEVARNGTLFLDEILNMPLSSQAKLLRSIQERTICRVGGTKPLMIDTRIVVASNKDLDTEAAAGSFRRDLFFRLDEFTIRIPPLRERTDDIPLLAKQFFDITNAELNKNVRGISESALDCLLTYDWPGNVRQLRSVIRRALLLADDMITEEHLDLRMALEPTFTPKDDIPKDLSPQRSLKELVRQNAAVVEKKALELALQRTGGNKAEAARALQIDYKTMHVKAKKYGIRTCNRAAKDVERESS